MIKKTLEKEIEEITGENIKDMGLEDELEEEEMRDILLQYKKLNNPYEKRKNNQRRDRKENEIR